MVKRVSQDDFYKVLGLLKEADDKAIKQAFRHLAHRYHPDKNPGDEHALLQFQKINEAYQVLSDKEKRQAYDLAHGYQSSQTQDDLFSEIFGHYQHTASYASENKKRNTTAKSTGRDYRYTLELEFEEAMMGCEKEITIPRLQPCSLCLGTGAKPGTTPHFCHACGGSGEVHVIQGLFEVPRTCTYCRGLGRTIRHVCERCQGQAQQSLQVPVQIKVPQRTESGAVLKFEGLGESGAYGVSSGDLKVYVSVRPHSLFTSSGDDLLCDVVVTLTEAILGATIEVPGLEGMLHLKLKQATTAGQIYRLSGQGLLKNKSQKTKERGDLLVCIKIETPAHLTEEQKAALIDLDKQLGAHNYPLKQAYTNHVKRIKKAKAKK